MPTGGIDFASRHRYWKESNPLREWRMKNKVSIHGAAGILKVSMSTIQLWEAGSARPGDENMRKLRTLLGDTVERKWLRWMETNPLEASGIDL